MGNYLTTNKVSKILNSNLIDRKSAIVNHSQRECIQSKTRSNTINKQLNSPFRIKKPFQTKTGLDQMTTFIKNIFVKPLISNKTIRKSSSSKPNSNFFHLRTNEASLKKKKNLFEKEAKSNYTERKNDSVIYELKFQQKNNKLRKNYLTKLISKNVWYPNENKKNFNSLFIYDWDDTFFCTTYLNPSGVFNGKNVSLEREDRALFSIIEDYTIKILDDSLSKGDVYIITNAAEGWVEFSTLTFYKRLYPMLKKINIISARSVFQKDYPEDHTKWKQMAFLKIQKKMDTDLLTNFICMGDSQIEMDASNLFSQNFREIYLKTIKLKDRPSPEDVLKQLKLVSEQFQSIYSSPKNLTVKVERNEI